MKMFRRGLILLMVLCMLLAAAVSQAETYVESTRQNPDQMTYQRYWKNIYLQVLQNHSSSILRYQARTISFYMNETRYSVPCWPVGLRDLNAEGIPELLLGVAQQSPDELLLVPSDLVLRPCRSSCLLYHYFLFTILKELV